MTDPELHFPDELEAVDYLMLRGEADPHTRGSMLSVALLDAVPNFARLQAVFERASREFIRLRQRVVVPSLPVAKPRWIVDPDFDINYHVSRVDLPAPGTQRELLDYAVKFLSNPIDISRPLWEMTLVAGLDINGCPAALLMKLHHSVTDGVGGLQLFKSVYDWERNPQPTKMPARPIPEDVSGDDLVRWALKRNLGSAIPGLTQRLQGALREAGSTLRNPTQSIGEMREKLASARRVMGPPPASPSPLLRRRSLGRQLDAFEFPLARIRSAAKAAGASVNDAYIAAVCGGLRRYHQAMGVEVETLPLAMPVNLRKDDDPAAGNRFAGARLAAPIAEPDPVKRMQRVREQVLSALDEPAIDILSSIAPLMNRLPDSLLTSLTASIAGNDVQASNVPGYPESPFIAGARVTALYPFGPVPGVAMMICMVSQAGYCYIGTHFDTASITDPELFRRCLREGFDEVIDSTEVNPSQGPRKVKTARQPAAARKSPAAKPPATKKRPLPAKTRPKKAAGKRKSPAKGRRS